MDAEAARFREKLQFLPALWKVYCDHSKWQEACRLELVSRHSVPLAPKYSRKAFDDTAFYVVHTSGPRQMPDRPEMERAHEGWPYHNTCSRAAFVVDHVLQSLLQGDPDIEDVGWYDLDVRGPVALMPDAVLEDMGIYPFFVHEVIILQGREGSYVIDLSAKQFGIQDWFFMLEDYEASIFKRSSARRVGRGERFDEWPLPRDLRFREPAAKADMELAWLMQFALDACAWSHRIIRETSGGPRHYPLDLSPYELKLAREQIEAVFDAGL